MTTRIRFLGTAAFEVVGPRHRILFDPFLTGSSTAPCGPDDLETPDVILVSHPPSTTWATPRRSPSGRAPRWSAGLTAGNC